MDFTAWMNLQTLCWLKETSHTKTNIVWLHLYAMPRIGKSMETEGIVMILQGWSRKKMTAMESAWFLFSFLR